MGKRLLRVGAGTCLVFATAIFLGPVASGAVFLLLPAAVAATPPEDAEVHEPLHKGGIDLSTGLYIRRNDDLVVDGAPALVLRRTYLSRDRTSRQFGIGTTHEGEAYLIGDGKYFQWSSLILPGGRHIRFERTSPGSSLFTIFEHRATPGEWQGARLGWTGMHWALRRRDGTLMLFQGCAGAGTCSIIRARDAWGRITQYRRDRGGRLTRMEASDDRWIAFDYDEHNRIRRAYASDGAEVHYTYDERGRLAVAAASQGRRSAYTYTDVDEMATIIEPGTDIENVYEDGRCVKQVNRYPDCDPYVFTFTYKTESGAIVQTDSDRSDGTWRRYTWSARLFTTSETWGRAGIEPAVFTYDRDPATNTVTSLTVTCPDRTGRPLRHSSLVRHGDEDEVKWNILTTHCSWTALPGGGRTWRPQ